MSAKATEAHSSEDEATFEDCEEAVDMDEDVATITKAVEGLVVCTDFSLKMMGVYFAECHSTSEELTIHQYLLGFKEVYKFMTLLGTVWGFAASDIGVKIDLLEKYHKGENQENYKTVKRMLEYESEKQMVLKHKKDDPSGSRTLLRLHRALEFVVSFLGHLDDLKDEDRIGPGAKAVYEATLMKHHIWPIQKAAKFAIGFLPTKAGLVEKVSPGAALDSSAREKVEQDFARAVESMRRVYTVSQDYYTEKELANIP
ncbi:ceramide-1-phosphate transfer protein [Eurytemora carolleeae]|uniref:ceramide-1-phosphate transfer protein n=1 Tax=Eurytemora carolleeae TaxID=1294199 RepID=UPI000C78313E|nr:ceramide-1-phosphate transfer protein [Eurytemora carolleeae]XP_023345894.1 ceramide-1-phosphate transfer protein [Eurytemora carolleeae]XP_023345895.1 ceramide-1-phosphate transfer protein [Eurytemora carolleeae]XP_023345896.1 ceramide-1-phosphate transfer protein [Eurytemora carolleeae]XP_023345897.1 ceramide-1-phosphate transfer protein [Eurytemora carolleeae]XP_023345898.1 ceramide-1-phosphate transfer protein [Eurytemora carolleeae]XP_023345899.1 ceramide-1-phosphate transfer protein |eukprot:XP_023345893.1 ceramide-1-phosphate transfer protein-like [Eurytemora affinis]